MVRFRPARAFPVGRHPLVSIVVPCYNYGRFLSQCVESVLAQPAVDVEVIIIDDASKDDSRAVAKNIAALDPRVSVIQHKQNKGHIATYNEGLDLASGDYSVLLSADDVLPIGALTRAVALMESDPSVGLVYGHPFNFSGPNPPTRRYRTYGWSIWSGSEWVRAQCRRGLNCIYSPEVVMRTSVRKAVGGFRSELPHTADLELWLRIATIASIGRVNGPVQAYRRIHGASMMQSSYSDALVDLRERKHAFDVFFSAEGAMIDGARKSQEIVARRLSAEAIENVCHLLESGAELDVTEDYIRFARESYRGVEQLRVWSEYQLMTHPEDGRLTEVHRRGYAAWRNLEERLRYRRWQLAGV